MEKKIVNKKDIINLYDLSDYQATRVIALAKHILVKNGFEYYDNRRIGNVPHAIVKRILAIDTSDSIVDNVEK